MRSLDDTPPVNGTEAAAPPATLLEAGPPRTLQQPAATARAARTKTQTQRLRHIWLVTGPAGCGKTTVAEYLAMSLDMPYIEGDSYHTPANVEKMRSGIPLTDADRWDWLTALRDKSMDLISSGAHGVVVTCSALKRKYRDVIRVAPYYDDNIRVHFIFLNAPAEVLLARVMQREGHYMGAGMVQSQFDILERPVEAEHDVISIDVSRSLHEVQKDALARVSETNEAVFRDEGEERDVLRGRDYNM